jgi:two-component sensor histidine kinase
VYRSGEAHIGRRVPLTLEAEDGASRSVFLDFIYQPIIDAGGQVSGIFVEGMDVTDHMHAEDRLQMLNDELKHRVKNTITVVSAIAGQTLRGADQRAELKTFNARLTAFGRAHDILTANSRARVSIGEVVHDALVPHRSENARFQVAGPALMLESQQALSLSLAIHELATNAFKYGALSDPEGHVDIAWDVDGETFRFVWQERGGPPVVPPARKGFGSQLLQRVLAADFAGKVDLRFEPAGVVCVLTAPQGKVAPA